MERFNKNKTTPLSSFTGAALAGQAVALQLLQAEMAGLAQLIPGSGPVAPAVDEVAHDAEVEEGFDNMPV